MSRRHYNIPIFIPQLACPHNCIFCNQKKISGAQKQPSLEQVKSTIENYLSTIKKDSEIEIAFFGGNFTGIPLKEQEKYLHIARQFINNGKVCGIRISTRPDYIKEEILFLLKQYEVTTIELGVQSMDDDVLKISGRGHTSDDVINASEMIRKTKISLGLQMMVGLPGDTLDKSIITAHKIAELGPDSVRVYPTLVIKGTELEKLYLAKKYKPLHLEEAVFWCREILHIFEKQGIEIIRMGLHPSKEILSGESLLAGPFHPSFRELVLTEIWRKNFEPFMNVKENEELIIDIPSNEYNYAIGYKAWNKKMLSRKFKRVIYKKDPLKKGRDCFAVYYR